MISAHGDGKVAQTHKDHRTMVHDIHNRFRTEGTFDLHEIRPQSNTSRITTHLISIFLGFDLRGVLRLFRIGRGLTAHSIRHDARGRRRGRLSLYYISRNENREGARHTVKQKTFGRVSEQTRLENRKKNAFAKRSSCIWIIRVENPCESVSPTRRRRTNRILIFRSLLDSDAKAGET